MPTAQLLTADTFNSSGTTLVSASFTPTNNALLVAIAFWSDARTSGRNIPTASGGGLTWTQRTGGIASADGEIGGAIWTAQVTTGASMTVTLTTTASWYTNGGSMAVYQVTDHNTSNPIDATAISLDPSAYSGAKNVNFTSTPKASSVLLGGGMIDEEPADSSYITSGTGWSSDFFESHPSLAWIHTRFQQSTGTSASQLSFANISTNWSHAIAGIAINAATSPERFITIAYW